MADIHNHIRSFGMSGFLITDDLKEIETRFGVELGHAPPVAQDTSTYYPQFDQSIRRQAAEMAAHYELFYCLEQSIRELIITTLFEKAAAGWWNATVPAKIVEDVAGRTQREKDSGF